MDGSVNSLKTTSLQGWIRLYNLTFLAGIAISFTTMAIICFFFPPPGLGVDVPFVGPDADGEYYASSSTDTTGVVDGVEFSQKADGDGHVLDSDEKMFKGFVKQV